MHVISAFSNYNAILGRTTLAALRAITSIPHLKMKLPTNFGIGEMVGDQKMTRECYLTIIMLRNSNYEDHAVNQVVEIAFHEIIDSHQEAYGSPVDETEEIEVILDNPDKKTKIGKNLIDILRQEVIVIV